MASQPTHTRSRGPKQTPSSFINTTPLITHQPFLFFAPPKSMSLQRFRADKVEDTSYNIYHPFNPIAPLTIDKGNGIYLRR
ncbi:hypothetical protein CCACVL1_20637 [Corchorus capsularis]|uniref:Uncharacterized protein n=1 Tax=Corchorus capsularis TaxID=210143 RepID=A0A1R3HAD6_COCAP|nr:hypothetical protein CCACVL1_20637 [Corchorus capsularis]